MENIETSFVAWINANSSGTPLKSLSEAVDCLKLVDIMRQASVSHFGSLSLEAGDSNWAERLQNLKAFMSCLDRFFQDALTVERERLLADIDLTDIARGKSEMGMAQIMELVIGAALSCEDKKTFIDRLMNMQESDQAMLMPVIQNVIERIEAIGGDQDERRELQRLRQANMKLSNELEATQLQLASREASYSEVFQELEDTRNAKAELEIQLTHKQAKPAHSNAKIMISEVEAELQARIERKDEELAQLQASIDKSLHQSLKDNQRLKDKLDVAQEKILTQVKSEEQLELYKKRLSDMGDIKLKNRELAEINESLKDKLRRIEDDSSAGKSATQALGYYKDQVTAEKERNVALQLKCDQTEANLQQIKLKLEESEERRHVADRRASQLEAQNLESDEDSFSGNIGSFELEHRVQELEEELVRAKSGSSDIVISDLNSQIENLLRVKKQLQNDIADERASFQVKTQENSAQLQASQAKLNAVSDELKSTREKNQGLKERIKAQETSQSTTTNLSSELSSVKNQEIALREELLQTKEQLAEVINESTMKDLRVEQLENHVKILESKLDSDGPGKIQVLDQELSEVKGQLKEQNSALAHAQSQIERLEDTLNSHKDATITTGEETRQITSLLTQKDQEINFLIKSKDEISGNWNRELRNFASEISKLVKDSS